MTTASLTSCPKLRLVSLTLAEPANLVPWISSNWAVNFRWRGGGPLPENEKLKLRDIVTRAHQQGRRVRFWGAPDRPVFWREMLDNGVDLINTDDLEGVRQLLQSTAKTLER